MTGSGAQTGWARAELLILAIVLMSLSAMSCSGQPAQGSVASARDACELAKIAVSARGDYRISQIVGCEGGLGHEGAEGHYILRLNGECHEEICGSVLLGWYAVKRSTGRVYDWDVGKWKVGEEVLPKS